jgi:hypothetical protein
VTNVVIAYSNLQLAHDQLDSGGGPARPGQPLLSDNEKKYKVGRSSQSDVITGAPTPRSSRSPILIAERQPSATPRTRSAS